ncbi:MAG: hypothetical protein K2W95_17040 [Candidatus Obscuribacterales bacterium]|nr:hypothetical protein [Candidatus Obscuribacterales bacterium]
MKIATGTLLAVSMSILPVCAQESYTQLLHSPAALNPPDFSHYSQNPNNSSKQFAGKQPGPLNRLWHATVNTVAADVGGVGSAAAALLTGGMDTDLPPDMEEKPEWPFPEKKRNSMYTIYWPNGAKSKVTKMPDGSVSVIGGGHSMTFQKTPGGSYAVLGEDGSLGTLAPRMDGGYTITRPDGTSAALIPRQNGGFNVVSPQGNVATVVPGPGGESHHVFSGNL